MSNHWDTPHITLPPSFHSNKLVLADSTFSIHTLRLTSDSEDIEFTVGGTAYDWLQEVVGNFGVEDLAGIDGLIAYEVHLERGDPNNHPLFADHFEPLEVQCDRCGQTANAIQIPATEHLPQRRACCPNCDASSFTDVDAVRPCTACDAYRPCNDGRSEYECAACGTTNNKKTAYETYWNL